MQIDRLAEFVITITWLLGARLDLGCAPVGE